MRKLAWWLLLFSPVSVPFASAEIFGRVQGIVHDPQHRPIGGALVQLRAARSHFGQTITTGPNGDFVIPAAPLGDYTITITFAGFRPFAEDLSVTSSSSPLLHFELHLADVNESVTVTTQLASGTNIGSVTPTTTVDQVAIERTPGADRTNSLQMITAFVPGAYVTHNMLHMRGGHQVSWQIEGVQIPNTNIGSNLGAQIDPKDIDYLEIATRISTTLRSITINAILSTSATALPYPKSSQPRPTFSMAQASITARQTPSIQETTCPSTPPSTSLPPGPYARTPPSR